jgi:hypothetical protein
MPSVYEASDTIEAQLLVDFLASEGIAARIEGEYLQGAIGELPASGLVRVSVDDIDQSHTRELIARWKAMRSEPAIVAEPAPGKTSWAGFAFVSGLAIGIAGSVLFFRAPAYSDGADYNDDGILDETVTYAPSGRPIKVELDRNLDGKIDSVYRYDRKNRIRDGQSDDDFNGVMETRTTFLRGNIDTVETDIDGDNKPDIRWRNRYGVLDTVERLDPASGLPARIDHFHLGALVSAEIDSDLDGNLDTRRFYDAIGNETRSERLNER